MLSYTLFEFCHIIYIEGNEKMGKTTLCSNKIIFFIILAISNTCPNFFHIITLWSWACFRLSNCLKNTLYTYLGTSHYLNQRGEGVEEKMGALNFFLVEHGGPLKVKRRVGGSSLLKLRNVHLPHFGIMFEEGSWLFLNKGRYLKNMNTIRLGPGNFFCLKNIFSSPHPRLK